MRLLLTAAIALLLAAIATELYVRLYAGHEFALLVTIAIAIFAGAIASMRATRSPSVAAALARSTSPSTSMDARESGRVKWFNRTKGFGFIVRDSGGEVFVHHRNISSSAGAAGSGRQSLRDGQRVSFVVVAGQKGPQAERVTPIEA